MSAVRPSMDAIIASMLALAVVETIAVLIPCARASLSSSTRGAATDHALGRVKGAVAVGTAPQVLGPALRALVTLASVSGAASAALRGGRQAPKKGGGLKSRMKLK